MNNAMDVETYQEIICQRYIAHLLFTYPNYTKH